MTFGELTERAIQDGTDLQLWAWRRWANGFGSPGRAIRLAAVRQAQQSLRAQEVRADLDDAIEGAKETLGDDLQGFALVTWGRDGQLISRYNADEGPISHAVMPTLVADALNRHVTVMMTRSLLVTDGGRSG